MRTRLSWMVGIYRAATRLLPPDLRDDGNDMVPTFAALWAEAHDLRSRVRLLARAFGRLPAVLVMEWLEFLGVRSAPGRKKRSGGMKFFRDVRFALRTLRKAPSFTLSTALLIAVGVGAVTTIFTLVDHVLLRPLPYPEAERLVTLDNGSHSGPFFQRLRLSQTVESWAGARVSDVNLTGEGDPLRLDEARVTRDFFRLFGARADLGRLLSEEDFDAADAVVLDGGAWRRIWGADPDVVGRTIQVDGNPVVVVGVVDAAFSPPEAVLGSTVDLWRPADWSLEAMTSHEYRILEVTGRLVDGSTVEAVQGEMDAIITVLAGEHRNYQRDDGSPSFTPVVLLADATVRGVRTGLGLLMGAVGLLLLVACANVAHLFLARGLGRTREMAVRRALGAGTGTLTGQLLAESLVVGLAGGTGGAALAALGLRSFMALNPSALPRQEAVGLDLRVLGFAVAVSAATSLVFGLLPALRSVRGELADGLRGAGRSATSGGRVRGLRNALVAGEVALSLILVASAGLLARSFVNVRTQEPGFQVDNVWTIPLTPTEVDTPEAYVSLMEGIREAVAATPGVEDATYGLTMPMERTGGSRCCLRSDVDVDGRSEDDTAWMHPVTSEYFRTLGIELLAGRAWDRSEERNSPMPVVIGEPLARELYGAPQRAIGQTFLARRVPSVVVGVAADTRHYGLEYEHGLSLYLPIEQFWAATPLGHVAVRINPAMATTAPAALRQAVWSAEPGLPVPVVRSMEDWITGSTAERRFESAIFATFAAVALLLAAGGLYGTLLFVAGERRKELGIRLAMGATRGRIEGQLLRSGFALGAAGVALGLVGAWFSGRFLESQIWGVERGDPFTLVLASGLLLVTALLASWVPARRAGRTDPLETLRVE